MPLGKFSYSLVFDIGTSSVKAGLYFFSDKEPIVVRVPLPVKKAFEDEGWNVDWWHLAIKKAVSLLFESIGSWVGLEAVVFSGNGPSVVALDQSDSVVGNAFLWTQLPMGFRENRGSYFLSLFQFMQKKMKKKFATVHRLLPIAEYFSFLLTGTASCFIAHKEMAQLYWDTSIESFSDYKSLLPPFVQVGDFLGVTTNQARQLFNIPKGVSVFAGGTDYVMAIFGTGAVLPGSICDRGGTSEGLNYCASPGLQSSLTVALHPVKSLENHSMILASSGALLAWYKENFTLKSETYEWMFNQVFQLEPQLTPLFFPSLGSEGGGRPFHFGCFAGLDFGSGRYEMGRAIFQSIGFEILGFLNSLKNARADIDRIICCGGQTRSTAWNQMKADILGFPLNIPSIFDSELTGCQCAARVGLGHYGSMVEASLVLSARFEQVHPNEARTLIYGELYEEYCHFSVKAESLVDGVVM